MNHMDAPITLIPGFFDKNLGMFFEKLAAEIPWEKREDAPRKEAYVTDRTEPYTYGRGRGERTYTPQEADIVDSVKVLVAARLSTTFDVCFCNMYVDGHDHLGWHADDSPEMDDARPIAVVSFGASREIQFRRKQDPDARTKKGSPSEGAILLKSGDLLVMAPGMQDMWEHRIPKTSGIAGPRISLTFRGYVSP